MPNVDAVDDDSDTYSKWTSCTLGNTKEASWNGRQVSLGNNYEHPGFFGCFESLAKTLTSHVSLNL